MFLGLLFFSGAVWNIFIQLLPSAPVVTLATFETFIEFGSIYIGILFLITDKILDNPESVIKIVGIIILAIFVILLILGILDIESINKIPVLGDITDSLYWLYHDVYDFIESITEKISDKLYVEGF